MTKSRQKIQNFSLFLLGMNEWGVSEELVEGEGLHLFFTSVMQSLVYLFKT